LNRVARQRSMKANLDTLKTEIERYLQESGMAVFHGYSRDLERIPAVYWDSEASPDYKPFIDAAKSAGSKLIVFHQKEFFAHQVDDALEQLEGCDLPREEYRELERRLNELRVYSGFICAIELSFDHQGRVYVFDLRTEWYKNFADILDEIQVMDSDSSDDTPMSGYFSKN